jgi:hypothetical protein
MAEAAPATRHSTRPRRDELLVGVTALLGAMLALPLATSSSNGPEVAATLAVAATCMLAGQRWARGLVALTSILMLPTLALAAFSSELPLYPARLVAFVALLMLVPALVRIRAAAASLVTLAGLAHTRSRIRRVQAAVVALGVVVLALLLV